LGSGQFGVVYQALQEGTVNDPKDTRSRTVAVKTTKSTLDPYALDCLISELKIMIHLGALKGSLIRVPYIYYLICFNTLFLIFLKLN